MKRTTTMLVVVVALVLGVAGAVGAVGAQRGTDYDPNATWLGEISWLSNDSGGHLWFTPDQSLGPYTAGHSYHNIYKITVDDPSSWCFWPTSADRVPYNHLFPAGTAHYYKIWDVTDEVWVDACP